MTSYASIEDYELRTGIDVPDDQEPMIQQRLDDVSAIIELYMGDCADAVVEKYPDILASIVVAQVFRVGMIPVGVRSESVGGTSVSFDDTTALSLSEADKDLLDALMASSCPDFGRGDGVGQLGINYDGVRGDDWPYDVDVWVM